MTRKQDTVRVETDAGSFDRFEAVTIKHSLVAPSEATFELGDDGAYSDLESVTQPGTNWRVYVNNRLQMTGRSEVDEWDGDADSGVKVKLTVRTKLSDAFFRSADPDARVSNTSVKDFILKLYEPLGYVESDFLFNAEAARDIITGKSTAGDVPADLEPIQIQQAKVQVGETIFDAAERTLHRHHLMQWDTPDGKICIGAPNDEQDPLYYFRVLRGAGSVANNLKRFKRIRDWSEVPAEVWVYGAGAGLKAHKSPFRAVGINDDVKAIADTTEHFKRTVIVSKPSLKTSELALAQATRDISAMSRRKNAWELLTDGWSYWTGDESIPFAINAVVRLDVAIAGGPSGNFLVHETENRFTNEQGFESQLKVVGKGIWKL